MVNEDLINSFKDLKNKIKNILNDKQMENRLKANSIINILSEFIREINKRWIIDKNIFEELSKTLLFMNEKNNVNKFNNNLKIILYQILEAYIEIFKRRVNLIFTGINQYNDKFDLIIQQLESVVTFLVENGESTVELKETLKKRIVILGQNKEALSEVENAINTQVNFFFEKIDGVLGDKKSKLNVALSKSAA